MFPFQAQKKTREREKKKLHNFKWFSLKQSLQNKSGNDQRNERKDEREKDIHTIDCHTIRQNQLKNSHFGMIEPNEKSEEMEWKEILNAHLPRPIFNSSATIFNFIIIFCITAATWAIVIFVVIGGGCSIIIARIIHLLKKWKKKTNRIILCV